MGVAQLKKIKVRSSRKLKSITLNPNAYDKGVIDSREIDWTSKRSSDLVNTNLLMGGQSKSMGLGERPLANRKWIEPLVSGEIDLVPTASSCMRMG